MNQPHEQDQKLSPIYGNLGKPSAPFFSRGGTTNVARLLKDIFIMILCLTGGFYAVRGVRKYFGEMAARNGRLKHPEKQSCEMLGTCPSPDSSKSLEGNQQQLQLLANLLMNNGNANNGNDNALHNTQPDNKPAPTFTLTPEQQAFLLNHFLTTTNQQQQQQQQPSSPDRKGV